MSLFMLFSQASPEGWVRMLADLNMPAVMTLTIAGVTAMMYVMRQVRSVQKEIVAQYISENTKLRTQLDDARAETDQKDAKITAMVRENLAHEIECARRIGVLEAQVADLERLLDDRKQ